MDEIEVKYRLGGGADHERLRAALTRLGARPERPQHEANDLYDLPSGELGRRSAVLRLRTLDGGPRAKLTYKGPARFDGIVKSRQEIETDVGDALKMAALLEALGYARTLTYAKEREAWRIGNAEVALDVLEFGHFCEIEGPVDEISGLADQLGLDEAQAEPAGYPTLTEQWQQQMTHNRQQVRGN